MTAASAPSATYLTAPQVAARFGIETTNVTAWGRSGRLAGKKALGTWRFAADAVEAFARVYLGVTDARGNLVEVNIDECWTVDELARRCGKSPSTLRRAAAAEKLTAFKHRDRWYFDPSDPRVRALVEI